MLNPVMRAYAADEAAAGVGKKSYGKNTGAEYRTALRLIKQEKFREALPHLESALEKAPGNVPVKGDYLLCLVWTGSYKQAADFYLRHENDLKNLSYVGRDAAKAFYETGDYDRARHLYEQSLLREPSDGEALKGLVYSLCHLEDYTGARQAFEQRALAGSFVPAQLSALEMYIHQQEGNHKQAYLLSMQLLLTEENESRIKDLQDSKRQAAAALSHEEMDGLLREQQAIPPLHDMIAMDSGRYEIVMNRRPSEKDELPPGVLLEMARGYFKAARDDEALSLYQLVIKERPDSCLAHIGMVYPLSNKRQFEEAAQEVRIAKKNGCFYNETLFAEAFLHEKQGDFLKAAGIYDGLLRKNPQNSTARKLKMRSFADLGATSYAYERSRGKALPMHSFSPILRETWRWTGCAGRRHRRPFPCWRSNCAMTPQTSGRAVTISWRCAKKTG